MATGIGKSPWRRIAITVSAMLVVLLLAASFRFLQSQGLFASVPEYTPAACRAVSGIGAVADIAVDRTGNVYLAGSDGIYVYDGGKAVRLPGTPKNFHPATLALGDDGAIDVLFRQDGVWEMSVFGVSKARDVKELGRLSADTLSDPAAVVTLSAGRFYLVNKHASHTAFGRWLDDTFLIPRANVRYFDGMKFVTVAERLNSPAGMALSPDGHHLYVAQELPRSLASFSRNEFVGGLDHAELYSLPGAPRKITVAPDGSLIVAAWPRVGAGAVYRVRVEGGVPVAADLLYASKSEEITAAAEAGGHLLIGSQKRLIDCRL